MTFYFGTRNNIGLLGNFEDGGTVDFAFFEELEDFVRLF